MFVICKKNHVLSDLALDHSSSGTHLRRYLNIWLINIRFCQTIT
jgi:hypothetical protein